MAEASDTISDERLAKLRERTGGWPSNSEECWQLINRLDAAEAHVGELRKAGSESKLRAAATALVDSCSVVDTSHGPRYSFSRDAWTDLYWVLHPKKDRPS